MAKKVFICPECGKELIHGKINFVAHARSHYYVEPRDVHLLKNPIAIQRYTEILKAAEQVVE